MKQFRDPQDWRHSRTFNNDSLTVASQFVDIARDILKAGKNGPNWEVLARQYTEGQHYGRAASFAKAAVAAVGTDAWGVGDALALSEAYLHNIAPDNLIDAAKRFALTLPDIPGTPQVTVATGATAYEVGEGAAKPLTRFTLDTEAADAAKAVAMLVVNKEVAHAKGTDAENLIRRLLRDAVVSASNDAFLSRIPRISIAGGGANAVESLKLGLAAAAASRGYVIAATPAFTRELALESDGRMGINGGEYIEGVVVLPALAGDSAGVNLLVIPASSLAIRDRGLALSSAAHATVEMQDAPTGNSETGTGAQMVNLWQVNAVGLKVERLFEMRASESAVEVS